MFYSRQLIEEYKQLAHVFEVINFANFKWNICTDYKAIYIIVGMYLGSQSRPCPYCIFHKTFHHHDKDYHYRRRTNWPHRTSYKKPASKCLHSLSCSGQVVSCKRHLLIEHDAIVDITGQPEIIIPPPLHIRLGLFTILLLAPVHSGRLPLLDMVLMAKHGWK